MDFENTVREMVEQTIKDVLGILTTDILNKALSFGEIVQHTQESINTLGRALVQSVCAKVDDMYAKERPKGIHIRNKTKRRTMLTSMGEITITRRLYADSERNARFFAVDELLSIPKYTRIEPTLQADLIKRAAVDSYGAVARSIGEKISRQSVYNIVKRNAYKTPTVAKLTKKDGIKTVEELFIEADEDHIHLNNGKSEEVKLVYVHEGRRTVNGRVALINPHYFVSCKLKSRTQSIWEEVSAYVYKRYNVRGCLHISGDGATWIYAGKEYFPLMPCKFHLDKFHVVKSITTACGGNIKDKISVFHAVEGQDGATLKFLYDDMKKRRPYARKAITDSFKYINNHLKEISFEKDNLCSAEGHVSHILSAHLSARPCGWSRSGAERIAKIRAYYFNSQGDFSVFIPKRPKIYAEKTRILPKQRNLPCRTPVQRKYVFPQQGHISEGYYSKIKELLKNFAKI